MIHLPLYDLAPIFENHTNGFHDKVLAVLHETVSHDVAGWGDIINVAKYLAGEKYAIHGMTDLEGHMGWARHLGRAEFSHAGGVNDIAVGIEQVSWIPYLLKTVAITKTQAWHIWLNRERQLEATAKLLAAWHNSDKKNHPLRYVDGDGEHEGVTSHWNVSNHFPASQGHTDCWPHHEGGYYPILVVIQKAVAYANQGYVF
jgi:hypothetical protein